MSLLYNALAELGAWWDGEGADGSPEQRRHTEAIRARDDLRWSSDCRRDVPMLSRLADAGGMEMRIFTRDGQKVGRGPRADSAASPNADIVNEFLREQNGQTYQSVPVAVFYTQDLRYLHHYIEFPAIYHKERIAAAMQARSPGETREQK
jgi:hypothetical protein